MPEVMRLGGTEQKGTFKILATTENEAKGIQLVPGIVYEHKIETQFLPDWIIEPIANAIFSMESYFKGTEILYFRVERGVIRYQFWIPPEKALGLAIPIIAWGVIALVLVVIGIFILRWAMGEVVEIGIDVFKLALISIGVILLIGAGKIILEKTGVIKKLKR